MLAGQEVALAAGWAVMSVLVGQLVALVAGLGYVMLLLAGQPVALVVMLEHVAAVTVGGRAAREHAAPTMLLVEPVVAKVAVRGLAASLMRARVAWPVLHERPVATWTAAFHWQLSAQRLALTPLANHGLAAYSLVPQRLAAAVLIQAAAAVGRQVVGDEVCPVVVELTRSSLGLCG